MHIKILILCKVTHEQLKDLESYGSIVQTFYERKNAFYCRDSGIK